MICLLRGHRPIECVGSGDFQGRRSEMCGECGKVFTTTGETQPKPRGYEAAAERFHEERAR